MCSTLSRVGSRWVKGGLSMPILVILYTGWERGYSHSIHKVMEGGQQSTKGVGTLDAR